MRPLLFPVACHDCGPFGMYVWPRRASYEDPLTRTLPYTGGSVTPRLRQPPPTFVSGHHPGSRHRGRSPTSSLLGSTFLALRQGLRLSGHRRIPALFALSATRGQCLPASRTRSRRPLSDGPHMPAGSKSHRLSTARPPCPFQSGARRPGRECWFQGKTGSRSDRIALRYALAVLLSSGGSISWTSKSSTAVPPRTKRGFSVPGTFSALPLSSVPCSTLEPQVFGQCNVPSLSRLRGSNPRAYTLYLGSCPAWLLVQRLSHQTMGRPLFEGHATAKSGSGTAHAPDSYLGGYLFPSRQVLPPVRPPNDIPNCLPLRAGWGTGVLSLGIAGLLAPGSRFIKGR